MGRSVRDVMTPNPETIEAGKSVEDAAKAMRDTHAGLIPVVDDGNLLGTVTDRDIALRVVAEGKNPHSTTAGEIASQGVITVEPDQDLEEALQLMARHQVRRLPVVENGRLVGIVAQADVARMGDEREVGEVVAEISR
jgi:CBS domain-containing protein